MDIRQTIDAIIAREGGFTDHPNDRGGPTKFGITQATLSAWLDRPATKSDVRALTRDKAYEIYESRYYTAPRLHLLPKAIQPAMLDCAVHSGPRVSVILLQRVLNRSGFGPLDIDGVAGPDTREAVDSAWFAMGELLIAAIIEERRGFLDRLIARDPAQAVFQKGWMARLDALMPEGLDP